MKKQNTGKTYVVGHVDGKRSCGGFYFLNSNRRSVYSLGFSKPENVWRGLAKMTLCPTLSSPESYRIHGSYAFSLNTSSYVLTARKISDGSVLSTLDITGTFPGTLNRWIAVKDGIVILSFNVVEAMHVYSRQIYQPGGGPLFNDGNWYPSGSDDSPTYYDCYLTKYSLTNGNLVKESTVQLPTTLRDTYPWPSPGSLGWVNIQTPMFLVAGKQHFAVGLSGKVSFIIDTYEYTNPNLPLYGTIWETWRVDSSTQRWPVAYVYRSDMMELVSGLSGVESDTIKDTGAVQITGRLREYAVGDIAQVELWNVLGHASIFEVQKYSLSSGIITTAFSLGSGWENSYTANNEEFMLREDGMFMTHITADIFDQLHKLKFEGDTAVRDSSGDITMDNETEGVPFPIYFTGKDYGSG